MLVPPGAKSIRNRLTIWLAAGSLSRVLSVVPINSLNFVVGPGPINSCSGTSAVLAIISRREGATVSRLGMRKPIRCLSVENAPFSNHRHNPSCVADILEWIGFQ
jgi:hypothetical protein